MIKKFALKEDFKQSVFFKEIKVWKNERVDNPEKRKSTLVELEKEFIFEYKTKEGEFYIRQGVSFDDNGRKKWDWHTVILNEKQVKKLTQLLDEKFKK